MFAKKNSGADSANLAANVYALGMLFYEILLGRTLFAKTLRGHHLCLRRVEQRANKMVVLPPPRISPEAPTQSGHVAA
jgi:hypothetical protein